MIPKEGIAELKHVDSDRKIYDLNTSANKKVEYSWGRNSQMKQCGKLPNITGSFYSLKALQDNIVQRCEPMSYE